MKKWRKSLQGFGRRYAQFVEKQGFTVIVGVCVAVIAATALWTRQSPTPVPEPTPPYEASLSAAELLQQSLAEAATPTPAPTPAPQIFAPPLAEVHVVTPFDNARMQPSGVTGVWRLHDAVDLSGAPGEPVLSMSDGVVITTEAAGLYGACITVAHTPDITASYMGMTALCGLQAGDPVVIGQTLGFLGSGVMDETDLPAHLHLHVTRNGQSIDPSLLWQMQTSPLHSDE
ncbi:MAG: M23 family metallopeptidase [Clostridia bacterium]|nr:M23 family metallopeptidase [Clostridia bacterium]